MLIQSSELVAKPGRNGALGPKMVEMREVLSEATGKEWWAWTAVAGRPYGTGLISTRHDDYADMVGGLMKLGQSEKWAALSASADGILAHPAQGYLNEVIAVTGEPTAPKQFTVVTRASIAQSNMTKSLTWASEVMEHVTKVTGQSGTVATSVAGTLYQVFWMIGADTPEDLNAMLAAGSTDAEYLEMIARSGADHLFEQGQSERVIIAKMP
jgi:hypothetical protein